MIDFVVQNCSVSVKDQDPKSFVGVIDLATANFVWVIHVTTAPTKRVLCFLPVSSLQKLLHICLLVGNDPGFGGCGRGLGLLESGLSSTRAFVIVVTGVTFNRSRTNIAMPLQPA